MAALQGAGPCNQRARARERGGARLRGPAMRLASPSERARRPAGLEREAEAGRGMGQADWIEERDAASWASRLK